MPRMKTAFACLFMMIVIAANLAAQMPVPKPAPELSKLDFLVGTWSSDVDLKPGPMGPGGKVTSTDEVHWMEGKFFLIMNTKFKGAMGEGVSMSVFGYDPDKKVYTYSDYDSTGQAGRSTGTVNGDTWTWDSDLGSGAQAMKGRFTMKVLSPTSYTYKFDMSKDGNDWTNVMEGTSTKK